MEIWQELGTLSFDYSRIPPFSQLEIWPGHTRAKTHTEAIECVETCRCIPHGYRLVSEVYDGCPVGYTLRDGICYRLVTASKTFQAAEAWCNAAPGGHLAAFHSQQEYDNLVNLKT